MTQQHLYKWIKHPECLNRETLFELRTLLARYPYFQTARLLYLKNLYLLHDVTFGEELRKAALFIADRRVLFRSFEGEKYTLAALEKEVISGDKPDLDRTLSLIDAFLSSLPEEQEDPMITLPVTAASDYTAYLLANDASEEKQHDTPKLKGQDWIDDFLEKSPATPILSSFPMEQRQEELTLVEEESAETVDDSEQESETAPDSLDDESYFTETLAKIYVKQQRYSKALEIISKLNLKYPKKNAYFADQIRFLEKLIINAKSK